MEQTMQQVMSDGLQPTSIPAPPPRMTTMGLALDANGAIWRYQGAAGYTQIGTLGDTGNTVTLGPSTPVTGTSVLAAGQWLFVTTAGNDAVIIQSTGTTTAPKAGFAYKITVGPP
jgi:hypothetical protein